MCQSVGHELLHFFYYKARYPPTNSFAAGMKLEACSYNSGSMPPTFSLATVVATVGTRILLHFDGADPNSDIWRLPDSGDIHPVGWTEGSLLKAPMSKNVICFFFFCLLTFNNLFVL